MSQTNFTPISIYYSTTASAVPTAANLVQGELAINTADGKLYYEDSSGVVQVLATKSTGSIGGSNTQVQFNNSGSLGGSSGLTWDGSFLTTSSIKNSALTSGRVTFAGASGLLTDNANFVFTGTTLGIGTASPVAKLDVYGGSANTSISVRTDSFDGTYYAGLDFSTGGQGANYPQAQIKAVGANNYSANLIFSTQNSGTTNPLGERMRITSAGLVGIGTSSPSSQLQVKGTDVKLTFETSSGASSYIQQLSASPYNVSFFNQNSGSLIFGTNDTERMRIDSSGNLLVGTTGVNNAGVISVDFSGQTQQGITLDDTYSSAGGAYMLFRDNTGATAGYISHVTATTVAYITTSDYRLKEDVKPMTGALAKIAQLKPVTYKWKSDGLDGQGFIAHELAEVVPDCVAGEKDAVYPDGSIKPQGTDTSFLVATLVSAIQEQQALIESLTTRLTALENK